VTETTFFRGVPLDVLCVGHASYDLIFSVPHHPGPDDKIFAETFLACGGGPAANAAVTVARLGYRAAFAGYLGYDLYGDRHAKELQDDGVGTQLVVRGGNPTPVSVILVKPDGRRSLVNYKGGTHHLPHDSLDFSVVRPKVILFDGHEPLVSTPLAVAARHEQVATVLDAGSLHSGTQALMTRVDYLVCSEKFAAQWLGKSEPQEALGRLSTIAPVVIVTLGERGILWRVGSECGSLPAFSISPVDTTGAGDAFHGAFAAGVAAGLEWPAVLRLASAAGALCCTQLGARLAIPFAAEVDKLLGTEDRRDVPN
jgi:sulfofructose kinase